MTGPRTKIFPDPTPFGAPFLPPRRRPVAPAVEGRLLAWCDELVPGVTVALTEWLGADTRHPLHALVVSFPQGHRPPVVVPLRADEVGRSELAQALDVDETPMALAG